MSSKSLPSSKGKKKRNTSLSNVQHRKEVPLGSKVSQVNKSNSVDAKATAKIPCSRNESSSNWKALLQKQGKAIPGSSSSNHGKSRSRPETSTRDCGASSSESKGSASSRRQTSNNKMSAEVKCDGAASGAENPPKPMGDSPNKVKQEFRALGLSESQQPVKPKPRSRPSSKSLVEPRGIVKRVPIQVGLNELGYFDYNHYGVLTTPVTPAHYKYMEDTGIIAMDCEMVGVGIMKESALARVSIVNEYGYCLYDRIVKPKLEITDYRTEFSGIREEDMKTAISFNEAVTNVANILKNHILVGHSLKSDMSVLFLNHPKAKTRDTALFFKRIWHTKTPKLRTLAKKALNINIQEGEHSSITDAQATMALYQLFQPNWEEYMLQCNRGIDVFQQTLDEFQDSRATVPPSFPNAPEFLQTSTDWYEESYTPCSWSDSGSSGYFQDQNSMLDGFGIVENSFVPDLEYGSNVQNVAGSWDVSPALYHPQSFPEFNARPNPSLPYVVNDISAYPYPPSCSPSPTGFPYRINPPQSIEIIPYVSFIKLEQQCASKNSNLPTDTK